MIGASYADRNSKEQDMINRSSYTAWEAIQFSTFKKTINKWRAKTLKIPRIHGHMMTSSIIDARIPFSAMWSPSFVPKPDDWPEQCRVVGTFDFQERVKKVDEEAQAQPHQPSFDPIKAGFSDVVKWFEQGPKPVFIGFGSMVINEPEKLEHIIKAAAKKVGCRIIVQSGWTNLDVSDCVNAEDLDMDLDFKGPLCQNVGRCPHDWLLPLCCAVVHHGGAGTTAAGLKHGLPTFVCPFFADQYMWSEMVARASVGPKPCPVNDLTADILADRLKELTSETIKKNAEELSGKMLAENGIEGGLQHFTDCLPVDNMFCDVNMLLGKVERARYRVVHSKVKVSVEVAAAMDILQHSRSSIRYFFRNRQIRVQPLTVFDYDVAGNILNCGYGCLYGLVGFFFNIVDAALTVLTVPDKWSYRYGLLGCLFGVIWFPFKMIFKAMYAVLYLVDAILVGCYNQFAKENVSWLINPFEKDEAVSYLLPHIKNKLEVITKDGISQERVSLILNSYEFIMMARTAFNKSKPVRSIDLRCDVVQVENLVLSMQDMRCFKTTIEMENAIGSLRRTWDGYNQVTFTQFCYALHPVVGKRLLAEDRPRNRESVRKFHSTEDIIMASYSDLERIVGGDIESNQEPLLSSSNDRVFSRDSVRNDTVASAFMKTKSERF